MDLAAKLVLLKGWSVAIVTQANPRSLRDSARSGGSCDGKRGSDSDGE